MAEEDVLQVDTPEVAETALRETLQKEYDTRLEEQVKEVTQKLTEQNKQMLEETIEKIRKEMAPPSTEDVQKLLEQEYVEFEIDIKVHGKKESRKFVIRELPNKIEKKIYKRIKDIMVPFSSELAALSMNMLEGDVAKKIVQIMDTFEPMLDTVVGVCTICLNPFGEEEDVTEDWVRENLSSTRIIKIVTAQMQCNKMRDFFSLLFQGTKLLR